MILRVIDQIVGFAENEVLWHQTSRCLKLNDFISQDRPWE